MFQDILQDSWVYQEITQASFEKGLEKGLEQGLHQSMISFLQVRFPEVLALAHQQTTSIKDPQLLQRVLSKLFVAQTVEEAKQLLLDINKQ